MEKIFAEGEINAANFPFQHQKAPNLQLKPD
jgi:hypothetical protein